MKKLAYILMSAFSFVSYAQDNWCGTDAKLEAAYEANPSLKQSIAEHMSRMHEIGVVSDRTDSLIIPVVFHVIHDNGIGNISYAQIQDAMRMLNEDFNRLNADSVDTRNTSDAPFVPVAANMKICFELAKLDPNGNCTDGVERRNSAAGTYNGEDNTSKSFNGGGLDAWNRSRYFNIWVVNNIATSGTGTTLGYAQFPYFGNASTYGVIIRHDRVGTIGTAVSGDRTLTHEVGHCFGLFHTFQDGCGSNNSNCTNSGDYCCDTPPVDQAHWSCSTSQNFCNQVQNNDFYGFDAFDQFENYMSYSPCQNMFSTDQKNVVLNNFNTYSWLGNLGTANNLQQTGVSIPATLCEANFSASQTVICEGDAINFSDMSYHGVATRNWQFTGGSPAISIDSSLLVTYNNAGTYGVTLDVSDGTNNLTETKVGYITVLPASGKDLPIIESFENGSFPDNDNFFSSMSGTQADWKISTTSASLGAKSIYYENYTNGAEGSVVSFESGTIDLSNLDPAEDLVFTFDYAYRKRNVSDNERLRVYVSTDCGETWTLRKTIQGSILGSQTSGINYQASSEDFTTISVTNISSSYYLSNFRYQFVFESDGGNNIFIDNINIVGESSLAIEESENAEVTIYPNPTTTDIMVNIGNLEVISYNIVNVSGQIISENNQPIINSNRVLHIETDCLANGVYYITFKTEENIITRKMIKQ
jgi:PKD repeat protein